MSFSAHLFDVAVAVGRICGVVLVVAAVLLVQLVNLRAGPETKNVHKKAKFKL
jgi:hypothetical protein